MFSFSFLWEASWRSGEHTLSSWLFFPVTRPSIRLLQVGFVPPRLRILSCPWHETYGFWHLFPVWFPLHQPQLTPSYLSDHFSLSGLGSPSSAPSVLLSPCSMVDSHFCSHFSATPVSPWLASSLYPELFLSSYYSTTIPQKLTLSLVPPELPHADPNCQTSPSGCRSDT